MADSLSFADGVLLSHHSHDHTSGTFQNVGDDVPYQVYGYFAIVYLLVLCGWMIYWLPHRKANSHLQICYTLEPTCKMCAAIILFSYNFRNSGQILVPIAAELLQNFSIYFMLIITLRGLSTTKPRLPSRETINATLIAFTVAVTSTVYYFRTYIGPVVIVDLVCFNVYAILLVLMFRGTPALIKQLSERRTALAVQGINDPQITTKLKMMKFCFVLTILYTLSQMVTGILEDFVFGDWPQWFRDVVDEIQDFFLLSLFIVFRLRDFNKTGRYQPVDLSSRIGSVVGNSSQIDACGHPGAGQPSIPNSDFPAIEMYPAPVVPGQERRLHTAPPPIAPNSIFSGNSIPRSQNIPPLSPPPNDAPIRTIPKTDERTSEWECMKCTFLNSMQQDYCASCEAWECAFCTFANDKKEKICAMCAKSRDLRPLKSQDESKTQSNPPIHQHQQYPHPLSQHQQRSHPLSQPNAQPNSNVSVVHYVSQPSGGTQQRVVYQPQGIIQQQQHGIVQQQYVQQEQQPQVQVVMASQNAMPLSPEVVEIKESTPRTDFVLPMNLQAAPGGTPTTPNSTPVTNTPVTTTPSLPQPMMFSQSPQQLQAPMSEPIMSQPSIMQQYNTPMQQQAQYAQGITQQHQPEISDTQEIKIDDNPPHEQNDGPPPGVVLISDVKNTAIQPPSDSFSGEEPPPVTTTPVPSSSQQQQVDSIDEQPGSVGPNILKILMKCNNEKLMNDDDLAKLLKLIRENPTEKATLVECFQAAEGLSDFVEMLHDSEYL